MRRVGVDSTRDDVLLFALDSFPGCLTVLDSCFNVMYANERAGRFLDLYGLPADVRRIGERMFSAAAIGSFDRKFPGDVYMRTQDGRMKEGWIFKLVFVDGQNPCIVVYFATPKADEETDMTDIGRQFRLTAREREVLAGLLQSLSNAEIADNLSISEQKVKDHLRNIYMKTGLTRRQDVLIYLAQRGVRDLIPPHMERISA